MASKSQTKYMATCALVVGVSVMMGRHYQGKPRCERIRSMLATMDIKGREALNFAHGDLDRDEISAIGDKIKTMERSIGDVKSFQIHLAGLIGIVGDRLSELPETSDKIKPLNEVLAVLENIHRYFEQRTRSEKFDAVGFEMLGKFDELFNPATGGVKSF